VAAGTRRVGITGAAGFVGRAVADRFRADGWDVVGVDRVAGEGVHAADVRAAGRWQELVAGCTLVVHTAALVSQNASRDDAWAVNVVGTRRVVEAVAPGARLVHFSSAAVYSQQKPPAVGETYPVRPTGRTYGDTKIASEHVVLAAHVAGEADVVVVRPSDVYGAGSRPWTEIPIAALRAGRLVLPAHGRGQVDPVHIDDLVDGVVAAALAAEPASRVYNLSGGRPVTATEFFGEYSRRLGLAAPRTASTRVATLLAEALGRAQRWRGTPSELGAGAVAMLAKTGSCSPARAGRELGWAPRVSLDEGMRRTVAALGAATSGGRGSG
jgi:nucleoside-diphosphate-sugar epimerase